MNTTRTILIRSFVKPFYRQHAGLFTFLFIVLYGAVGRVDGAGLFDYHFSLIRSILINPFIYILMLFLWLLYAKKCEQFILNTLNKPEFSFLQMLSLLESKSILGILISVQMLLFLPIIVYAVIICIAGIYLHDYMACGILLLFILSLCLLSARWYLYHIQNPGMNAGTKSVKFQIKPSESSYWGFFIRYIGRNKKLLFAGIKIFSCGILYGMLVNQTGTDYELNMIILFFSLGILGHGLLIHQIRELEETRLTFYRSVPISLLKRFIQYAVFYFILLVPEIVTIVLLTPKHLSYSDGLLFVFFSYSLLLFLHSFLFIQFFPMKDYLKIILCLYLTIYCSILMSSFPWLCVLLFLSSLIIFRGRYYQYERQLTT
jgi:hypothetical protein